MSELAAIGLGVLGGVVSGVLLGLCFVCLLGCEQLEMQLVTMIHATMAMVVMGAWVAPALLPRDADA